MNIQGHRILKTTAAVVGISALGALGSGTAFAATPTGTVGGAHTTHAASDINPASASSSTGGDLHSFEMPKTASHTAEPTTGYNGNDNNDNARYQSSDYGYGSSYDNGNSYNNGYSDNYNNGYSHNYDNGYYNDGYRHNDDGLLGGGLLGGNN